MRNTFENPCRRIGVKRTQYHKVQVLAVLGSPAHSCLLGEGAVRLHLVQNDGHQLFIELNRPVQVGNVLRPDLEQPNDGRRKGQDKKTK